MSHVKFDEETKVWTSCDGFSVPLYNPKISMSHIVLRSLEQHGPKIAQVMKYQTKLNRNNRIKSLNSNFILDKR